MSLDALLLRVLLHARLGSTTCWLHGALAGNLRETEPGNRSLIRFRLVSRTDGQNLQSGPTVAVGGIRYWFEESIHDAVLGRLAVEPLANVVLVLIEVQLPAVSELRRPGVGHPFQPGALNCAAGELRDPYQRKFL
ncbi:hypothetical protein ABZ445_39325 [Streptomyces chartreusis]|uniref:hypothetical protein n=1 Tax=Streptomyces chartreusis TaxID=1969 RepID=UPI0034080577